jgi:hypothetical protein
MFDTSNYVDVVREDVLRDLVNYGKSGVPVGDFLRSVLTNNLTLTICRADESNIKQIKEIVMFVNNELPSGCWGSLDKYESWLTARYASLKAEEFINEIA